VSSEDQLQWEARFARPAALAAFVAGLLTLAGTVVFQAALDDRRGIEPQPDLLLSIDESPGNLIASAFLQAAAALLLVVVFYYLFRAIVHRVPQMPRWFVYLIFLGPAMYAISQLIVAFDRVDVAEMFAERSYSFPDADPPDRGDPDLRDCPAIRGQLGEDCAEELLSDNANGLAIGLNVAGSVGVAFLYVMLPLRARRAGLLSPFMSILGVIAGVLIVLPLLPLVPVVIQAFWLGAIGALYLGNWPGGRGPAWESGKPEPWPMPARRRLGAPGGAEGAETDAAREEPGPPRAESEAAPEPEPAPERPSSRKRKRKRR
jgi:hypothetical protein